MSHTTVGFLIFAGFAVGGFLAGGLKILSTLHEEKGSRIMSDRWRRQGWGLFAMCLTGAILIAALSIWVVLHP